MNSFETTFHQELKWDGTAPNPEKWIGTPGVTMPISIPNSQYSGSVLL